MIKMRDVLVSEANTDAHMENVSKETEIYERIKRKC